jgi:hypothetical protein
MALSDLTFGLFTDSSLTTPFSGLYQLTHQTDLSDNPQDFVLYFGSAETAGTRQLEATSNPGTDQITITPTDTIDGWVVATAYTLGDYIEPSTPNGNVYECTTAGTSHATTEPTWPTTGIGSTVTDGTAVWTLKGAKHATTEIKLASTSGGLSGATAGAAMNLGTTITSGSANKVEVNLRVTNAVTTVRNNTGQPELGVFINEVVESEV